jgi:hypothetical protein
VSGIDMIYIMAVWATAGLGWLLGLPWLAALLLTIGPMSLVAISISERKHSSPKGGIEPSRSGPG